tara:strand:+ start:353 stop:829 length:477 start_codon:yes stop_codon:yes gene_type:complete
MPNLTDNDQKIWNFYKSNLKSVKKKHNDRTIITDNCKKFQKILKPNVNFVLDKKTKRQLYNRKFVYDALIDLHGKTEIQAHEITKNFIKNCFLNELKSIVIITGKGANNQGILKLKLPLWLKNDELSKFVVGFETMPNNKGGEGALFVKLKNKNKYKL